MTLTDRDHRILDMLSQGYTTPEIAKELYVSHRTVEARLLMLRRVFECKNTTHLVAVMIREGWIS